MLIAYEDVLRRIGHQAEAISYALTALNFIGYFAVSVKWSITAPAVSTPDKGTVLWGLNKFKAYHKLLRIANFYTWFLAAINIGWYVALILQVTKYHRWNTGQGEIVPSIVIPAVGLGVEVALRTVYTFSQYYSQRLMMCWAYDWPELGKCIYSTKTDDDDIPDADSL